MNLFLTLQTKSKTALCKNQIEIWKKKSKENWAITLGFDSQLNWFDEYLVFKTLLVWDNCSNQMSHSFTIILKLAPIDLGIYQNKSLFLPHDLNFYGQGWFHNDFVQYIYTHTSYIIYY